MPKLNLDLTDKSIKDIGNTLTELRLKSGMSQMDLCRKMKKPQSSVSRIERATKEPSLKTLINYIDKLGYKIKILKK